MWLLNKLNPFSAKDVLIDFTLSNARRFYSSKGPPLALKGLICISSFAVSEQNEQLHRILRKHKRAAVLYRGQLWPATYDENREVTSVIIPYTVRTGGWFSRLGRHKLPSVIIESITWMSAPRKCVAALQFVRSSFNKLCHGVVPCFSCLPSSASVI